MRSGIRTVAVVVLCILAPIGAIDLLTTLPAAWLQLAKDFQTVIGASVALGAAIIAFANVQAQIEANRLLETSKQAYEQRQIASALVGELDAFVTVTQARQMVNYYRENAAAVRASGRFTYWSIALSPEYDKVFSSLGAKVGMLPDDLPERVVRVYAMISGVFDRMTAAEHGVYDHLQGEMAARIIELIAEEAKDAIRMAGETATGLRESRRPSRSSSADPSTEAARNQ